MGYNWKDEVFIITGATSGLGKALALKAGELKATSVLIGRDNNALMSLSDESSRRGGKTYCFDFDLNNVDLIPDLYRSILERIQCKPTILMNIVGYQVAGFVQNTPIEIYEKNFRINTLASIALMQLVLPDMLCQKKGLIANVMSSIMYHSFPGVSSYCATKFALRAIHESLKLEMADRPVKTLLIRPGTFRSNYWKNTDTGTRLKDYILPTGESGNDPAYVADKIIRSIENNKDELDLSTFKDKIGYYLSYWCPGLLEKIIVSRNQKLLRNYPV